MSKKENRILNIISTLRKTEGKTMLASMSHDSPFKILISTILSARARRKVPLIKAN